MFQGGGKNEIRGEEGERITNICGEKRSEVRSMGIINAKVRHYVKREE